jgi:hypothetical protein
MRYIKNEVVRKANFLATLPLTPCVECSLFRSTLAMNFNSMKLWTTTNWIKNMNTFTPYYAGALALLAATLPLTAAPDFSVDFEGVLNVPGQEPYTQSSTSAPAGTIFRHQPALRLGIRF